MRNSLPRSLPRSAPRLLACLWKRTPAALRLFVLMLSGIGSSGLAQQASLELVSGSVTGQLRTDTSNGLEVQPYTVGTTALQTSYSQTLAENYKTDLTVFARLATAPGNGSYTINHTSKLRTYTNDVSFDDQLTFRFAPTPAEPAGTQKRVRITGHGYSTNLWNGFGGSQGIGENSYGELLAPDWVSSVDGTPSVFKVTFNGQTMDLTRNHLQEQYTFEVTVGETFTVDIELFAIAMGRGTWKGVTASVTVAEVPKTSQTIEFTPPQEMFLGDLDLSATTSSGLPVAFEVVSGPGTINGNTLTATAVGYIRVKATQPGNDTFGGAPPR